MHVMLLSCLASLHISVISIVQEKVADHLNEVGSKKRVYSTDFDPYDTDLDVEYDVNFWSLYYFCYFCGV